MSALPAGFQEFYLPLQANITQDAFVYVSRSTETTIGANMHYIVGVTASADNTVVYYDHWENGLQTGTGADEIVRLNKGQIYVFEASNVPANNRGTSIKYDGGDRIFVSGSLLQLVVSTWPESIGTVLSDAWEIYPTKAWNTQYIVPVGQDIGATANYADFSMTTIQVMSATNGNTVTISPPGSSPTTVTLNQGQAYSFTVAKAGTSVTGTAPVQVQIIAGDNANNIRYSMRGYTITPRQYWGTSYYAPVPSWPSRTISSTTYTPDTDLFLYNPNLAAITVQYQTRVGSGSFSIPAGSTKSFYEMTNGYVPTSSGVYLSSSSIFWGIGSCDTRSATFDWAYSLVPEQFLGTDNYISWAPGTRDKSANHSPVFITATTNRTTVYVYYAPDDGVPDQTFNLDRLQSIEVFDPDNDNSGMHVVSTAPVAMAWGQSPRVAGTGDPSLDMGYTTLPLPTEWIDISLDLEKTAEPTQIRVGGETTFTLNITVPSTAGAPVADLSIVDKLPPGWQYVPGSTKVDGIAFPDPAPVTGNLNAGYTLTWNGTGTLVQGSKRVLAFRALSTASVSAFFPNRNVASVTGTSVGATLTADSDAFVTFDNSLPGINIAKSGPASARIGEEIQYTFIVTNTGNLTLSNVTVNDELLGGNITGPVRGDDGDGRLNTTEVWVYEKNYTVPMGAPNPLENTAVATADYQGIPTSDLDDYRITLDIAPGINLAKEGPASTRIGEEITYTFNVTNTGNVPLRNVTVVDEQLGGKITGPVSGDDGDGFLELGEEWYYTATYTVPDDAPNPIINNATVSGDYLGAQAIDTDPHTTTLDIAPGINLAKEGPATARIGETITYTFNVTNTGNVPLRNVTVNDPLPGLTVSGPEKGSDGNDVLDINETWNYTATYTVPVGAPNPLENIATAAADYEGVPVQDTDGHTTTLDIAPVIKLVKNGLRSAQIDETITYTFNVTNIGNVPLRNVTVDDPLPGLTISGPEKGSDGNDVLDINETWNYTATYTVRDGDPNPLENNATVTGDYEGRQVHDTDDFSVPFDLAPGLKLVKVGPASAKIDEEITFEFILTNTGNVPLSNVTVTDPLPGITIDPKPDGDLNNDKVLDLTEIWRYNASYRVPADAPNPVLNNATATGDYRGNAATDSDEHAVTLNIAPDINLEKEGPASATIGETITYTFNVTNTGNVPLRNVMVTDPLPGVTINPTPAGDLNNDQVLDLTETWRYTATYTVPSGAPNPIPNTATARGDYQGLPAEDSDPHAVTLNLAPGIQVAKSGPASAVIGEEITYTFNVTNIGNVPLSNVIVNDPLLGGNVPGLPSGDDGDNVLEVGEIWNYTATYIVPTGAHNPLVNHATATGVYEETSAQAYDAHTTTLNIAPAINIAKYGPSSARIGDEITYTFNVTNAGNVPLSNVIVKDPLLGGTVLGPESGDDGDGVLELDESWNYSATYTVPAGAPNPLVNTVTASGDYEGHSVHTDDYAVTLNLAPGIHLAKEGPASATIGQTITYTFTVTNTGNVPLSNVTLTDPLPGITIDPTPDGDLNNDKVLDLTETWRYTATYIVPTGAPNPIPNTATVTGDYRGDTATDSDDHTVTLDIGPGINLAKEGPASATIGQTITYTFTVTNTGNVPLSNVTLTDPLPGITIDPTPGGDLNNDKVLDLTETWNYTATYTVPSGAPNPIPNTATVIGDHRGDTATDSDDHSVTLNIGPGINLAKEGPASAIIGQTITYTFTVTNTGNVPLRNVTVTDPLPGITIDPTPDGDLNNDKVLDLTETWNYTATYTVPTGAPNPIPNTATVTGDYRGHTATDSDDHTVTLNIAPEINVVKTGPATAGIGDKVTYTFTVTNSGEVPLANLSVTDNVAGTATYQSGDTNADNRLDHTETWIYTVDWTVAATPDPLLNTVTASGQYGGETYTDKDEHSLDVLSSGINVTKTGPATAGIGDKVTYTFTVTNSGEVPLANLSVTDNVAGTPTYQSGDTNADGRLDNTETWIYTVDWRVAATPDPLLNTVTASGQYGGVTYTDKDEHSLDVLEPGPAPAILLEKSGPATAYIGEKITYTFKLTNTGSVPLTSVTITDPMLGGVIPGPTGGDLDNDQVLDLGESWIYSATYTVPADAPVTLRNSAVARAISGGTETLTADSSDTRILGPAPSPSVTVLPSETATLEPNVTVTATVTPTVTTTPTATMEPNQTATATTTPTATMEPNQTATATTTPGTTMEPNQTATTNVTQTQTVEPSGTTTVEPNQTATANTTSTITTTPTATTTRTPTITTTVTQTPSKTPTITVTTTPKGTPAKTPTATVTKTPTKTTVVPTKTPTTPSTPEGKPNTGKTTVPTTKVPTGQTTWPTTTDTPPGSSTPTKTTVPGTPDEPSGPVIPPVATPSTTIVTTLPSTEPTASPTRTGTATGTPSLAPTGTQTGTPTPVVTIQPDLCPVLPVPTGPVTVIDRSTVITAPGFYALGAGVVNTTALVWLDIRASDVTIDGMGRRIDGVDRSGSYGIRVRGDGILSNVTIHNLTVTDFAYGIAFENVKFGHIVGIEASSNTYDGILVVGGHDNRIECSIIDRDDDGINLVSTDRAFITHNIVTENVRGSGIHLSMGCDEATLLGNYIAGNDEGIEIDGASKTVVRANRILSSRYYGLNLTTAQDLTIVDNHFSNVANLRVPTGPFSGTWYLDPVVGPNVMGNRYLGGNYWGTPDRTGFSDTTPDANKDGFVDGSYQLPGGLGEDRFPLGPPLSSTGDTYSPGPTGTFDQADSGSDPSVDTNTRADEGVNTTLPEKTAPNANAKTTKTTALPGRSPAEQATPGTAEEATPPTLAPGFGMVLALAACGCVATRFMRRG